jgi:hypothetical protein
MEAKTLSYFLPAEDPAPLAGHYLVAIGQRGINSIYLVLKVHQVKHKKPRAEQLYMLQVATANHLRGQAVHDEKTDKVWVAGTPAHPLFWHSRNQQNG